MRWNDMKNFKIIQQHNDKQTLFNDLQDNKIDLKST